jgi:hypothetical protein
MAADYRHIGGRENRLGRHYSRFSPFSPTPALASQSLALRKLCDAGSNRRRRANLPPSVLPVLSYREATHGGLWFTAPRKIPIIKRLKWHTKGSTKHFDS